MATGKLSLIIDSDDFAQGMTTSSNLTDGGISPESDCLNMFSNPGVMYPPQGATTIGTMDGTVISSCYDTSPFTGSLPTAANVPDRYILTSAGSLYTLINGVLSSGFATGLTVVEGLTDMQVFLSSSGNPLIHITHATQTVSATARDITIIKYTYGTGFSTFGTLSLAGVGGTWTSTNPHPMMIYNKLLYYCDGNFLHTYDGSTLVAAVLTLEGDQAITAIQIDVGTGNLMLGISARGGLNGSLDYTTEFYAPAYIGLYDGVNPTQLVRKIGVDNTITALYPCGGYMYGFYGDCIGIWNGNGFTFIRRLYANSEPSQPSTNIYKSRVANVDSTLMFVVNNGPANPYLNNPTMQIIAYGEILQGQKFGGNKYFFPMINMNVNNGTGGFPIEFVANVGYDQVSGTPSLIFSLNKVLYLVQAFLHSSVFQTGDNSPIFVSKRYAFPRKSTINEVRIFYENPVSASGSVIGNMAVIDDNRGVAYNQDISNPSTGTQTGFLSIFPNNITTEFQLKYWWKETSTSHGIQKIMVFYTYFE